MLNRNRKVNKKVLEKKVFNLADLKGPALEFLALIHFELKKY